MRRIALCAALALGCVSAPTTHTEALLQSRHALLVETPNGHGSGFPITDDAFLTARHVVAGQLAKDVIVGGWTVLEIVRLEGIDAALLVTGLHGREPWPIASRGPRPGERVWKSGYGQEQHWWTEGLGTDDEFRVALDIFPGDSGGPVFNAHGEVLGIVVMIGKVRRDYVLHHCWIVPGGDIQAALPGGEAPDIKPPAPLPVPETPWERFQRLKKERGL